MSDVRKHQYMHEYPFVCTQAGTRPMTKQEQKQAQAYLLDVIDVPERPLWVHVVSGLAIVTGIVVGVAVYVISLF